MRPGKNCDAHQLPAAPTCTCPRSFMRQRGHHPKCPIAAEPTPAEEALTDRAYWQQKYNRDQP
ncbi:hypothetical protein [Streptomyces sp. NPDC048521]|uniref:hypothetical protein n=1 Tax=Streptomyces sp. NPDC048521 TaxID=3365566 RepID=UPI00371E7D84